MYLILSKINIIVITKKMRNNFELEIFFMLINRLVINKIDNQNKKPNNSTGSKLLSFKYLITKLPIIFDIRSITKNIDIIDIYSILIPQ